MLQEYEKLSSAAESSIKSNLDQGGQNVDVANRRLNGLGSQHFQREESSPGRDTIGRHNLAIICNHLQNDSDGNGS